MMIKHCVAHLPAGEDASPDAGWAHDLTRGAVTAALYEVRRKAEPQPVRAQAEVEGHVLARGCAIVCARRGATPDRVEPVHGKPIERGVNGGDRRAGVDP